MIMSIVDRQGTDSATRMIVRAKLVPRESDDSGILSSENTFTHLSRLNLQALQALLVVAGGGGGRRGRGWGGWGVGALEM